MTIRIYCELSSVILDNAVSYQQRCCVAGQVAGPRLRPLSGWSRARRPWRCWSLAAGCWPPESTPSTGCRCPAWTPWGGGTQRSLPLHGSPRRSGRCCRCWWRTGWSSDLKNAPEQEEAKCNLVQISLSISYRASEPLQRALWAF